ncbi:MAG TPA: LysM peptidoglycan-binding domain-containing protein [Candidatus Rhabdochlamydia sp.]|jgi:LysM repeat protein|nr:LysM peptidoglycan-binding domain-containing protein [Candidatus Rhabdochlamydia sp.]
MSRKDTIIIAVLVNAGLLIILFASALKPPMHDTCYQPIEPLKTIVEVSPKKEVIVQKGDAVDHALEQFAKQRLNNIEQPAIIQNPIAIEEPKLPQISILENNVEKLAGSTEVTIKKGDMLEKIARQYHTTVHEIMRLNGLQTSHLRIGQVLKIPSSNDASPVLETAYYIVKEGDNPSTIAKKNHIKLENLLKLNEMSEEKARKLRPGDKLRIR